MYNNASKTIIFKSKYQNHRSKLVQKLIFFFLKKLSQNHTVTIQNNKTSIDIGFIIFIHDVNNLFE